MPSYVLTYCSCSLKMYGHTSTTSFQSKRFVVDYLLEASAHHVNNFQTIALNLSRAMLVFVSRRDDSFLELSSNVVYSLSLYERVMNEEQNYTSFNFLLLQREVVFLIFFLFRLLELPVLFNYHRMPLMLFLSLMVVDQ